MQTAKRQAWKCARSQSSVVGIEHLHSISLNAAQQHSRTMGKYFYLTYDEEGYRCKFGVYNLHLLTPPSLPFKVVVSNHDERRAGAGVSRCSTQSKIVEIFRIKQRRWRRNSERMRVRRFSHCFSAKPFNP